MKKNLRKKSIKRRLRKKSMKKRFMRGGAGTLLEFARAAANKQTRSLTKNQRKEVGKNINKKYGNWGTPVTKLIVKGEQPLPLVHKQRNQLNNAKKLSKKINKKIGKITIPYLESEWYEIVESELFGTKDKELEDKIKIIGRRAMPVYMSNFDNYDESNENKISTKLNKDWNAFEQNITLDKLDKFTEDELTKIVKNKYNFNTYRELKEIYIKLNEELRHKKIMEDDKLKKFLTNNEKDLVFQPVIVTTKRDNFNHSFNIVSKKPQSLLNNIKTSKLKNNGTAAIAYDFFEDTKHKHKELKNIYLFPPDALGPNFHKNILRKYHKSK